MHNLNTSSFVIKRIRDDWKLLLSIFLGITIATSLIAGASVYINTLERQSFRVAIDRASDFDLNIFSFAPHITLDRRGLGESERELDAIIERHIPEIYSGRERFLKAPTYLVEMPGQDLALWAGVGTVTRGYVQQLSNLESHVTFLEGRMATDAITQAARGPGIEAVISSATAGFFSLRVNETLTLTPSLGDVNWVSVRIVGIMAPTDPSDEYWQNNAGGYTNPEPLTESPDLDIRIDPREPPIPLFVTNEALIGGLGEAYPGTLVRATWYIYVEKEPLKRWSTTEARVRIVEFGNDLSDAMPGSAAFSGIGRLVAEFETRSFFSSVPILLLLVIMVMTVLYYLAMIVSYLVKSREGDVALLRSRGVSLLQLFRLYALEGSILTAVAIVLAPFLAMGGIAVAGKLPYFREITGGEMLPVEFHWTPFLFAAGAGVLSLAIFVVPGVLGGRTGVVAHKLRSSRPPSIPFFQRYYLDFALLGLGGLIFWELHERGQLVSSGLFQDVQVNEALLVAPVLVLTVVALLFMRFFPLFVRFISGESPALLHLLVSATLVTLVSITAVQGLKDSDGLGWLVPVVLLGGLAGVYWATGRAQRPRVLFGALAVQAVLAAVIVMLEPPVRGDVSFVPTISLISMVPAQILFLRLRAIAQIAPVWLSMGLWRMARNPLQYSWLVLLLVIVTGLGVLATTVGGTLDRSHEERILYEVAGDFRVSGVSSVLGRNRDAMKRSILGVGGVDAVSLGFRGQATVGTSLVGSAFDLLALESSEFSDISWYRDDFSVHPLRGVMAAVQSSGQSRSVPIPTGATSIGVWAKPKELYANMFLWMVIQDARGIFDTVSLGETGPAEWHLMQADIPPRLVSPLQLVSVQLFQPVYGPAGTPGNILLDNIHVTTGDNGQDFILDDFESTTKWIPLATSVISSDIIAGSREDVYDGNMSGIFVFGKDTDRGIRGFYQSPGGRAMPVVASSSFLASTGAQVGNSLILEVRGRLIPMRVTDKVDYFPTLNPDRGGFIIADLDHFLGYLNMVSPSFVFVPNELFIAEDSGTDSDVVSVFGTMSQVKDRESLLASLRLDPLVTAGWKAMVVLSIGVIVFTAGLGYVVYLLSFADRGRREMGFLQSMGLSRRQLIGLLTLEHLVMITVGLGLGTLAGFLMSSIMVSSVAITERGDPVIPPFILTTDWSSLTIVYLSLLAIFATSLFRLTRSMVGLDLNVISRVELD